MTDAPTTTTKTEGKPRPRTARPAAVAATSTSCRSSVCACPAKVVDVGFWGGLTGAAVLGAIDPPLAILVGAGVVIARHQAKK